jgi:A/G-specific adenine glycosylase
VHTVCGEFGIDPEAVTDSRSAEPFRHSFTHFHLDIEPVYVRLTRPATGVAERDGVHWYAADDARALGLSAPAVRLLRSVS